MVMSKRRKLLLKLMTRKLRNQEIRSELNAVVVLQRKKASKTQQQRPRSLRMTQRMKPICLRSKLQVPAMMTSLSRRMMIWRLKVLASLQKFRVVMRLRAKMVLLL